MSQNQNPAAADDAYGSILLAMHRSANFMERRADNHLVMTYGEKRHHRLITQMLAGSPGSPGQRTPGAPHPRRQRPHPGHPHNVLVLASPGPGGPLYHRNRPNALVSPPHHPPGGKARPAPDAAL